MERAILILPKSEQHAVPEIGELLKGYTGKDREGEQDHEQAHGVENSVSSLPRRCRGNTAVI